jgi:hypothetical protein
MSIKLDENTPAGSGTFVTLSGDATSTSTGGATTVVGLNGTNLAGLATGILKITTATGVPSIAVAGDFPTLNQNTTGNAATVTTNANLTGDCTSSGNATTVVKINGTSLAGLATGILKNTTSTGIPSIAVAGDFPTLNQNTTGNAATVTTNANLTGPITSVGNATSVASQTGTGSKFVMDTSPTLVTPALGTPSSCVATNFTGTATGLTAGLSQGCTAVRTVNAQTGTTYTFALTDGCKNGNSPLVTFGNAGATTVTVPPNSSVAFQNGSQIELIQVGAGKVTIAAGAGVTITSKGGNLSVGAQYVAVSLIQLSADNWILLGDLIA